MQAAQQAAEAVEAVRSRPTRPVRAIQTCRREPVWLAEAGRAEIGHPMRPMERGMSWLWWLQEPAIPLQVSKLLLQNKA